jgi:putative NADPH-quinone reductase
MLRRVAIIQGHPDPAGNRFCHALADAYAEGAVLHEVTRIEPAKLDFPILRRKGISRPGTLMPARDAIIVAQHLFIIFPLWHGTMPALLKAFIEQVMRPGVALEYRREGFPRALLTGARSSRRDDGDAGLINRWYFRAHGVRGVERSILRFAGMKPVRETLLGMVQAVSEARRRDWLDRLKDQGKQFR